MKKLLIIPVLLCLCLLACKKENDSKFTFEGITLIDDNGNSVGYTDTTDWRTDDVFTMQEQQLFDTLDFSRTHAVKSVSSIIADPFGKVVFYPNPAADMGNLMFYGSHKIFNMVIVDNTFSKVFTYRAANENDLRLNVSEFDRGIYRAYYVYQDSASFIIGMGHGDIELE